MKIKQSVVLSAVGALVFFSVTFSRISAQEISPAVQAALDAMEKEEVSSRSAQAAVPKNPEEGNWGSAASSSATIIDVLELKDMDINDVLKLVSKKSGLNIAAGKNVAGRVTIYLKNIDVRDALQIILESNDLAYVEENGVIKVLPGAEFQALYGHKFGQAMDTKIVALKHAKAEQVVSVLTQLKSQNGKVSADAISNSVIISDRAKEIRLMEEMIKRMDIPVATKVFDLRYAKAEDVVKKLDGILTKNIGKVESDARSNKIVVTDTEEKIIQATKMIQAFDVKHQEVLIEAKIVSVELNDSHKLGVDWEAIVRDYHSLTLQSAFDVFASGYAGNKGALSIGTLSTDDYEVLIDALDTVGKTNVLSNPRIAVINNEEAKILVGSNEPYATTQTTVPASGPTTTSETVNFIEVGVKLFVTPNIHGDGYITMKIRPEVSSLGTPYKTSTGNEIPVVETSQAETTVMAKDGATIVIGGLIKENETKTINKIPFLGDLPLLGVAFRNDSKIKEKQEIVIFLTPKIITGDHILEPPKALKKIN